MYCRKCGSEIFDEAVVCPKCGCPTQAATKSNSKSSGKITAAKIFIILSAIFGIFLLFIPTIVGCFAISKLDTAKSKNDITTMAIMTLIFCNTIAGILMLTMTDEDFGG